MDLGLYLNTRPRIQTGDLLAFAGTGMLSQRILAVDGHYSHVAMVIGRKPYECHRWLMVHAVWPIGITLVPCSREMQDHRGQAWWIPMKHQQVSQGNPHYRRQIEDEALLRLGLPYDWKGVLSYVLPWIKADPKAYYCSEFVGAVLYRLGITDQERLTPSQVVSLPVYEPPVAL